MIMPPDKGLLMLEYCTEIILDNLHQVLKIYILLYRNLIVLEEDLDPRAAQHGAA
jgi:hypothetical protein